jgi:hypothetical protein
LSAESSIVDIQNDAAGRAQADEYFADITVITDRAKDISTEIAKALGMVTSRGGRLGVCVIVRQPVASDPHNNAPGGPMNVKVEFLTMENPVLNLSAQGTGKHALAIARRLHLVFKHYVAQGIHAGFIPDEPCITPTEVDIAPVAYLTRFWTREAAFGNAALLRVDTPVINPNGGEGGVAVTITCATPGASIYYTLNGGEGGVAVNNSHPSAANPNAILYAGPFVVPLAGATVKAVAYKTGYIASNMATAVFTPAVGGGAGFINPESGGAFIDPESGTTLKDPGF